MSADLKFLFKQATLWSSLLLVGLGALGHVLFQLKAERQNRIPERAIRVAGTPAELSRGKHLATSLAGCTECHGDDLGGKVMDDNALLRLTAPNITAAGVVADYNDADWTRALLHGVDRRGRNLLVMPAKELRTFSDADIGAIIAYVRTVAPVERELPRSRVGWIGKVVLGLAGEELWPANTIAHQERRDARETPIGATVAHGEYLLGVCKGCHGPNLRGGLQHGPEAPASADISPPAMAGWSREQFARLMREGKRRDGTQISPAMPWRSLGRASDEELTALWLALRE